jgi:hypothetical protein
MGVPGLLSYIKTAKIEGAIKTISIDDVVNEIR